MGTKISALTEVTAPNSTDMLAIVNSATTKKVQVQNVIKAGTAIWARVYHNANQSISNNTLTALAFNSERADTDVIHDTATNNSRLTCKTAGVYSAVAMAEFATNATGVRQLTIRLNGTTHLVYTSTIGSAVSNLFTVSTVYALAVNDYLEALVYQNSGGSLNILASTNYSPEFMMVRLGA